MRKNKFILGFLASVLLISATMFISGVAIGGKCDSTSECDAGLFCCVSGCGDVGHPTCQLSIPKLKCTTDADCEGTKICKDRQCIRSSTTSAETNQASSSPRGFIAVEADDPNVGTCYVKNSVKRTRFFGLVISN